jgi:chitodextrinase
MRSVVARGVAVWIAGVILVACSDVTEPGPSAPESLVATLATPTSVQLTWTARPANEKVTAYPVYRNGVRIGETTNTSFTDAGLAENVTLAYSVSSMIASGYESSRSAPVSITTRDVIPPRIIQSFPANGSGPLFFENITVSLVFSEAMDSSSINASTFNVRSGSGGATPPGTVSYYKTSHIAEFRGPFGRMPAGTTIVVTAAGMKDLSGNVLSSPLTFSFTTSEDVRPFIVSTVPTDLSFNVSPDVHVKITFSEPMDLGSLATRVYDLSSNLPGDFVPTTGAWDAGTNTQTLDGNFQSNHRYQVVVGFNSTSPAKDLAGNTLVGPNSFTFSTIGYYGPPVAVSFSPARSATNVDPSTQIRVTFNEPLDPSTVTPEHFRVYSTGYIEGTVSYEAATYTAVFTPSAPLVSGRSYGVDIFDIMDATGVFKNEYVVYTFTVK